MGRKNEDNSYKSEMIKKYFNMVYRLALTRTKNKETSEDICQDVFYAFLKTKKKFKNEDHIKAWLIRVTVNKTKSVFLSAWYKKTTALEDDIVFTSNEVCDLFDIVSKLPKKYSTVIYLYYKEDMSIRDIAKILRLKENTVKSRLLRAREKLKSIIGQRCDYDW